MPSPDHLLPWIPPLVAGAALAPAHAGAIDSPAHADTALFEASAATPLEPPAWDRLTGDGAFGRWTLDEKGMPAYDYTLDQRTDPRAVYETHLTGPSRDHWFQLGNLRHVVIAHVDGVLEVFDLDDVALVRNHRDDSRGAYGGGFGYLIDRDAGTVTSSHHDDLPGGTVKARRYGVGHTQRRLEMPGLTLLEQTTAPDGAHPLVVQAITLTNTGSTPRRMRYLPYWDVNLYERYPGLQAQGGLSLEKVWTIEAAWDPAIGGVVAAPQESSTGEPRVSVYPTVAPVQFLVPLDTAVTGYDTDERVFFGRGSRSAPEALEDGAADSSGLWPDGDPGQPACLVLQSDVALLPGESRTLSYAWGFTDDPDAIPGLVEGLLEALDPAAPDAGPAVIDATREAWAARLPWFDLPGYPAVTRELTWSAWMLSSASIWSRYADAFTVTQGGAYVYDYGLNAAPRDPLQHALALVHTDPWLARETMRYWLVQQRESGHLPYAIFGSEFQSDLIWKPSDLSLWLLLLAAEYVQATGDSSLLAETLPYFPAGAGKAATGLDHLIQAWRYQIDEVGIGRHGLLKLGMYDWNDTLLPGDASRSDLLRTRQMGESTLNTAMAVYLFPRFAALLEAHGQEALAEEVHAVTAGLRGALMRQWRGTHFNRAYVSTGEVGAEVIYLEPQPWALLAPDLLTGEQASSLISGLEERLRNGSPLGCRVLERAHTDAGVPGEGTNGGVWASVNGWLAWGAGRWDGTWGWQALLDSTLANHATVYPELWYGIWGGPDSWNSNLSDRPGQTWYIDGFSMQAFPIQNLHPHAWPLYAAMQLLGVQATGGGLTIAPAAPLDRFSLSTALLDLEGRPGTMAVTLHRQGETWLEMRAPAGWPLMLRKGFVPGRVRVRIDGRDRPVAWREGAVGVSVGPGERLELRVGR